MFYLGKFEHFTNLNPPWRDFPIAPVRSRSEITIIIQQLQQIQIHKTMTSNHDNIRKNTQRLDSILFYLYLSIYLSIYIYLCMCINICRNMYIYIDR